MTALAAFWYVAGATYTFLAAVNVSNAVVAYPNMAFHGMSELPWPLYVLGAAFLACCARWAFSKARDNT